MATANETKISSPAKNQEESRQSRGVSGGQQIDRSQRRELSQRGGNEPYFPSPAEFLYNPFSAMRRMHEDMDRMFAQAFGVGGRSMEGGDGGRAAEWAPAIEVKQEGNQLKVCAELPGLKPEEVKVELNDNILIIEGERRQEHTSEEGRMHRTERRYGRFYRAITLPEGAKADQASAEFHDGVLEISVPITEQQTQRREIPVSSGGGTPDGGRAKNEPAPTSSSPKTKP